MTVFFKYFLGAIRKGTLLCVFIMACSGVQVPAVESAAEPERELTERQVDRLAELYISAVEDKNADAWKELLSPLHSSAPELNEEYFLEQIGSVESLSVQEIDGYNVQLRIRHASGERMTGTLQMDPAGRIKYTPFCFKHPLYEVAAQLELLLNDRVTIMGATCVPASRAKAAHILDSMGIPMCEYNPYATSSQERVSIAQNILEWVRESGHRYDASEPRCFLPPDAFSVLIERLERSAR